MKRKTVWRQAPWCSGKSCTLFPVETLKQPQILFLAFPDATGDEIDERLIVPIVGVEQCGDVVATDDGGNDGNGES